MNSEGNLVLNWKIFREDTEAGRLLRRLYGVDHHAKNDIAYPRPKVKRNSLPTTIHRPNWTFSRHDGESRKVSNKKISVPKVGNRMQKNNHHGEMQNKLHAIPRRKTYTSCAQSVNELKTYAMAYRPPNQKLTTTEDEKIKLAQLFEKSAESIESEDVREEGKTKTTGSILQGPSVSDMANQIYQEIKERHQFQIEMESFDDKYSKNRNKVIADINNRIKELMKYDKELAKKLLLDGIV